MRRRLVFLAGHMIFDPSSSYKKDVANPDLASFRRRSDVQALVLGTKDQVLVGDPEGSQRVIVDALPSAVRSIVEENAAPRNSAGAGPVVDRALVVCIGADNVAGCRLFDPDPRPRVNQ
ncbi:hypothetical protein RRF57_013185 [Xylaria bambusicola]|uniref:Uncharacterized protein n=1 Tax=Xylaria bambusicola TaxID=326684 RepID=A0AAN7UR90_9PEZI